MEQGVTVDHDLEKIPLEVKTHSETDEEVNINLYDSEGSGPTLVLRIKAAADNSRFLIGSCTKPTKYSSELPAGKDKIWRITKLPGPLVQVHCNGVMVVDFLISDPNCDKSGWEKWFNDVVRIQFDWHWDSASNFYRPFQGDYLCNWVLYRLKIIRLSILEINQHRVNLNSHQQNFSNLLKIDTPLQAKHNRRPYWWGGVVAAFNQSDYSIDRSNFRTVVTCQNKFTTPPHQYRRLYR